MKKLFNNKNIRRFNLSVLMGILLFLTSTAVSFIGGCIFRYAYKLSFVNDKNGVIFWFAILIILFIAAGNLFNLALGIIIAKKNNTIVDAMNKINNGEFSAKLQHQGKLTDPGIKTINAFNDMAEQLHNNEMINKDFISTFSHELKSPIGTIGGFAKILKDSGLSNEERAEYLDIIIEESDRLSHLSGNILMLARLDTMSSAIEKETYNLTEQIRQIIARLYQRCVEKDLEIELTGDDIAVSANNELLQQVWINLLDNAIKFSPENEKISVDIKNNADCITVSIKNYENTLSEDDIPHIFEKFYQGAGGKKTQGNGLGLTLIKKIIELHSGSITAVKSKESTIEFVISLPY